MEAEVRFQELNAVDEFYPSYQKRSTDFVVVVACRPGTVSYDLQMDLLIQGMEVAFEQNDYLLLYPGTNATDPTFSNYDDINTAPLAAGVETIQKIGREVGSIFKKKQ